MKLALEEYMNDLEDIAIAEKRISDIHSGKETLHSLEDVIKELGL